MYVTRVYLDIYICLQWLHVCFQVFMTFCKCFRRMLQVFQLFWMYAASVSYGCCKSSLGVAHVTMRLRSEGGAGDVLATQASRGRVKCRCEQDMPARAWAWSVDAREGDEVQYEHSVASTIVLQIKHPLKDQRPYVMDNLLGKMVVRGMVGPRIKT
jgi:hypothetical protein